MDMQRRVIAALGTPEELAAAEALLARAGAGREVGTDGWGMDGWG
jgi:hypothetical protein